MKNLQNAAVYTLIPPGILKNAADWPTFTVDTCVNGISAGSVRIIATSGTLASTAITTLKLQASATANGTYADLTGTFYDAAGTSVTGANFTAALAAATGDYQVFIADFNLEARSRFIRLKATAGAANGYLSAVALLGDLAQAPNTSTEIGAGLTNNTTTTCAATTGADTQWIRSLT